MQHKYISRNHEFLLIHGKHTMLNFLKSLFALEQKGTIIEKYISSKNPLTTADVEHWEKEYARKQNQGWAL